MGTGTYDYITFAQAKQNLAAELDDPRMVHWSNAELGLYIREAMTEWQAFTGYWRDRGTFTLTAGQIFYDLATNLRDASGNLMLEMAATDSELMRLLEYHLLEPPTIPYTGSTQFTMDEITSALQTMRNDFLVTTGSVITHSVINVPPAPNGRFQLDDHTIDVRRVAWLPTVPGNDLRHLPLWMSDEFAANASLPGWNLDPDTPESYSIIGPRPLEVQLIPVPLDKGQVDLLTMDAGPDLNPLVGIPLGVPTNYVWAVKWAALTDLLLQDGEPRDDFRANYSRQRYNEACEVARMMPVILTAGLNEVQVFPQAVADLDGYRPDWAQLDGIPESVACAGQNMIAIAPPPDANGPYSFRADVVRNAVVPTLDTDFLQIGREYLDEIIHEAHHLALFKSGGAEFADTYPLHQSFVETAASYNDRLKAMQVYLNAMSGQSNAETKARPRRESDVAEVMQ